MNKADILAMEAGRELDAEVTMIMQRWTVYDDDRYITGGFKYRDHNESTLYRANEWTPSENVEHALKVLEEFEEYEIRKYVSAANEFMYECSITIKEVSIAHIERQLPHAICKAALLAVMDS